LLGISIGPIRRNQAIAVGVVFRGNSWLDGVLSCTIDLTKPNPWLNLLKAVMRSRQYSQLHAIILSRSVLRNGINVPSLAKKLSVPVVAIVTGLRSSTFTKSQLGTRNYQFLINGKRISVLAKGVTFKEAQEIFEVGCSPHSFLPEATRVADLIAKHGSRALTEPKASNA